VAYRVRSSIAKDFGWTPNLRLLRHGLGAVKASEVVMSGSAASAESAAEALASQIAKPEILTDIELWKAVVLAHLLAMDVKRSLLTQGNQTQKLLSELTEAVVQPSDAARFELNLVRLHPIRQTDATELRSRWEPVVRIVAEMASPHRWKQFLEDLSGSAPSWMEAAPPEVWGLLGDVALDRGLQEPGLYFISKAVEVGASPQKYWRVRLALTQLQLGELEQATGLADVQDYPLASAMKLDLQGDDVGSRTVLEDWEPSSPAEKSLRYAYLSRFALQARELDKAISIGREGYEVVGSTSSALTAVSALLERSALPEGSIYRSDPEAALRLALNVREDRRMRFQDSVEPTRLAVVANRVLRRPEDAWRLTRIAPEGSATVEEAADVRLVSDACLLASELGLVSDAIALLPNVQDQAIVAMAKAYIADASGADSDELVAAWEEAMALTDDLTQQKDIAFQLAYLGKLDPAVDRIREAAPGLAQDISTFADVMSMSPEAEARARDRIQTDRAAGIALTKKFARAEEWGAAALVAKQVAARWSDSDLWLRAAQLFKASGDRTEGLAAARSALATAPAQWGGRYRANMLIVEFASGLGDWNEAGEAATQLMSLDPEDPDGMWAYLACRIALGDFQSAREVYERVDSGSPPRNPREFSIITTLYRQFGDDLVPVEQLIAWANNWRDDVDVRGAATLSILMRPRDPLDVDPEDDLQEVDESTLPAEERERRDVIRAFVAAFFEDFPESDYGSVVTVNLDDPLAAMGEVLGPAPDTREVDRGVGIGALPIGVAATVHARSFAEVVTRQRPRFAGYRSFDDESAAAAYALEHGAVVDATAAHSMATLDAKSFDSSRIRSAFVVLEGSIDQYLDASAAYEASQLESSMRIRRDDSQPSGVRVELVPPEVLARERDGLERLASALSRLPRLPRGDWRMFGRDDRLTWTAGVELARSSEKPLWIDDQALRQAAIELGVRAFGTPVLVQHLASTGRLTQGDAHSASSILVADGLVGFPFDPAIFDLAAELTGWGTRELAWAFRHGPPGDPDERVAYAAFAIKSASHDPLAVENLSYGIAAWLMDRSKTDEFKQRNVTNLLRTLLRSPGMSAQTLPFVLRGVRAAVDELQVLIDPFPDAVSVVYRDLANEMGHSTAANYFAGLMSTASPDDRSAVNRVIFLAR
jgi:sulfur relay (sulfurtransferase) DsrF/TusC family protein